MCSGENGDRDGQRFVMLKEEDEDRSAQVLRVVLNWTYELKSHTHTDSCPLLEYNLCCRQKDRNHAAGASCTRRAPHAEHTIVLANHVLDNGEPHTAPFDALR